MKPIVLTHEQRKEIERRRKGTHDRRIYQRLTAKRYVPETSVLTRVSVADGIQLLFDGTHRLPSPSKLGQAVSDLRAALGVGDLADGKRRPVR